ncbi:TPA: pirin family protein [Morganella morganii subsp. morganii]|uniref:Pirin family protein n=1 Tax=Morganella morganii TaxID=582 RepID=A0AAU8ZME1_MORMO|nr:pirin family protein [Morganella morganii]HDU8691138.1 pirin family protein [Morganella morganii subsp. morganii]AWC94000.1 pirin family protein [Morganella morganii]EKW8485819.1 pirin family protein [Morganella morganii]EKW8488450.1 pirin family protein [Morganella morganii]HAT3623078.1 pirin family protein [Morganella morganii]
MIIHRTAGQAGSADYGWLQAKYAFSFGHYFDPGFMGYGPLKALNQEVLAPGAGFQPKSYPDVDIVNLILRGKHDIRDNDGLYLESRQDECLFFSPRKDVSYTETNPCEASPLTRIQIWLKAARGSLRGSSQKLMLTQQPVQLIASPDGEDGSLDLQQGVRISHILLPAGESLTLPLYGKRAFYQSVHGTVTADDGQKQGVIECGDGAFIQDSREVTFQAKTPCRALLIDILA